MATTNGSRSVSLLRKASIIGFGVRTLVRDIELAKQEMSEKVKQAGVGAGMLAVAGVLALCALGALTAAAILALAIVLPAWSSALIVGGAWALVTLVVALIGRAKLEKATPPVPKEATRAVRDDARYLAAELKRGK
jgi:Putative Actinobacterial Holin-X, holin superfamily III